MLYKDKWPHLKKRLCFIWQHAAPQPAERHLRTTPTSNPAVLLYSVFFSQARLQWAGCTNASFENWAFWGREKKKNKPSPQGCYSSKAVAWLSPGEKGKEGKTSHSFSHNWHREDEDGGSLSRHADFRLHKCILQKHHISKNQGKEVISSFKRFYSRPWIKHFKKHGLDFSLIP